MRPTSHLVAGAVPAPGGAPGGRTWVIAHRGFRAAEGYSVDDLASCRAAGASAVEFDVRATSGGGLFVRHGSLWPQLSPGPQVADVVAAAVEVGLSLYVDVKTLNPAGARNLAAVLADVPSDLGLVVASSSRKVLRLAGETMPDLPRAVLFRTPVPDPVALARRVGASLVHPCWEWRRSPGLRIAGGLLDRVHDAGLGMVTWHEERAAVLAGLAGLSLFGVCTDDVAAAAAALSTFAAPTAG